MTKKVMNKYLDRITAIGSNTFIISQTSTGKYVLRNKDGYAVSPELSGLAAMFRWCNTYGYCQVKKNPLRRTYVGTERK